MTVKFLVGRNEVTITASKQVLNKLGFIASDAERYYRATGYPILASEADQYCKGIYNALDATGFYNGVKEGTK